ncbi:hypothetical protein Dimus_028267 [Dionaea muscipula]
MESQSRALDLETLHHFPPELRERISEFYPDLTYEEALEDQVILSQLLQMSRSSNRQVTTGNEGSCSSLDPFALLIREALSGSDYYDLDYDEAIARSLDELGCLSISGSDVPSASVLVGSGGNASAASSSGTRLFRLDEADTDTDRMTYEELQFLGEAMGRQSKGLSKHEISSLESFEYKSNKGRLFGKKETEKDQKTTEEEKTTECSICLMEFENGHQVTILPCVHQYHKDCINPWLIDNKICPICREEVKLAG